MIEIFKTIKRTENFFERNKHKGINNIKLNKSKQKKLNRILNETKIGLENEGYHIKQSEIQNTYEQYKNKPHFIIENNKYNDLNKIIEKLKKSIERIKKNTKEEKNIRNNIFSILLEQLKHKIDIQVLVSILKDYLDKQDKLTYTKISNNHYYYDLLNLIDNEKKILERS